MPLIGQDFKFINFGKLLDGRNSHLNSQKYDIRAHASFLFYKWLESDYRIKGGEVWTGISKLNESHFAGRPGGIPFEPLNIFYPTVLQSYPVVLNQIALGPCTKLRLYNRTKKSVQKLKNVGIKEMISQ